MNALKKIKQKIGRINWLELILPMVRDLIVGFILLLVDKFIN